MIWFRKRRSPSESSATRRVATPQALIDPLTKARHLLANGRAREAVAAFEAAGAGDSADAEILAEFGQASLQVGEFGRAQDLFTRALAARPDLHAALLGRAEATFKVGDFGSAAARIESALDAQPGDAALLRLLAVSLHRLGQPDAAESILARLTSADPGDVASWDLLGLVRLTIGGPRLALPAFAQEHEREARDGRGLGYPCNYPITLTQVGEVEAALDLFESELPDRPDPYGFFTYAMALLRAGAFRSGWHFYEFRWMTREFLPGRPRFDFPPWTGQDVAGKTVMLLGEQGFGDAIQFVRYAKLLHERGAVVVAVVRKELVRLLASAPGVSRCSDRWDETDDPDYFAHLMSLPHEFGTTVDSVPREVPYLAPPADASARWRGTLGSAPRKIGLVWAGNPKHAKDRYRSLSLDSFAALAALPDTVLFCLHNVAPTPEVAATMADWGVVDLAARLTDFGETAAAIAELDLVISVDTSVAHLAGALGKPVWLIVSDNVDFRWMDDVDASPWYPTLRIFRQRPGEAWDAVVERIAGELAVETIPVAPRPIVWTENPRPEAPRLADVVVSEHGTLAFLPDGGEEALSLAAYGEWRSAGLHAILKILGRGASALDIAPGVGAHAIAVGQAIGAEGHLLAMEWRRPQRLLLAQNLETNGVRGCTLLDGDPATDASIDSYAFERLDLLRLGAACDVTAVLEGARDTLWRLRPAVVLDAPSADGSLGILNDSGYDLRELRAPLFESVNFAHRTDDIFAGRQYSMVFALPEEVDRPAWFGELARR